MGELARATLDEIAHYVALLDRAGHVIDCNRAVCEAAGVRSADELRGQLLWQTYPWSARPELGERLAAGCARASSTDIQREELDGMAGTGLFGSATELSITLRTVGARDTAHLVVQCRDVTERKLAELRFEAVRRERDALLARLARAPTLIGEHPSAPSKAPWTAVVASLRGRSARLDAETTPSPSPLTPVATPVSRLSARPRVLVVEDNHEMNHFLTETLSLSFEVDAAHDGVEGLEHALRAPPDLVLTDVMMPRLGGDGLVRELRARKDFDDMPIVLLTARADEDLRVRLLREGAQDYLAKPFSARELLVRVGNLVDVKRARQVLREEVATQGRDLESAARALATRSRQLEVALESARQAREHAEQAGEAKNLFLSVASHELRTPLAALQLRIDRLRRSHHALSAHEHDETFRGVQNAIDRLTMLVESLLQYTKVQSNVAPISPTSFDAAGLMEEVVEEARARAERKGLGLRLQRPSEAIKIDSDPGLLRIVVSNLIDNAIKFTEAGEVEVGLEARPGCLRVNVRDTGPGVPAADRARIFEPFQHLEPADRKHTPGVGLGLALVREVMTSLNGTVELHSEVGTGSTFSVVLPTASALAADTH